MQTLKKHLEILIPLSMIFIIAALAIHVRAIYG